MPILPRGGIFLCLRVLRLIEIMRKREVGGEMTYPT